MGNDDDSDDESPMHNRTSATMNKTLDSRHLTGSSLSINEQLDQQKKACKTMMDSSAEIMGNGSQRSMGDILSAMDQELHQSIRGTELLADKPMVKSLSAKKSLLWGRKSVSYSFIICEEIVRIKTAVERGKWLINGLLQ